MKTKKTKSNWEWYAIKLLFISTITGDPDKCKIDENYDNKFKLYEEQIVVIKAQSSEHAYRKADEMAKESEMEYYNPYGQLVKCEFVDSLNCQRLYDSEIRSGSEIYSRLFKVPVDMETEKVIKTHMPETIPCDEQPTPFYNFLIEE